MHPLGQVFVEDEAKDVIGELIRVHLAVWGVGDVPELLLKLLLLLFGHFVVLSWCLPNFAETSTKTKA